MKSRKSGAVFLFIGALLVFIFAVGLTAERNPGAFVRSHYEDLALNQFVSFCVRFWLPAGIAGIPLLLVSLILSLLRERKEKN